MIEQESVIRVCSRDTFRPAPMEWVRWLALNADIYRMQQAMHTNGRTPPTWEAWEAQHQQGYRFCASMRKGRIVAYAAVLTYPDREWELTGVETLETYRRQGHARAVCTFITEFILSVQPRALCRVPNDNVPLRCLLEGLGYTEI